MSCGNVADRGIANIYPKPEYIPKASDSTRRSWKNDELLEANQKFTSLHCNVVSHKTMFSDI